MIKTVIRLENDLVIVFNEAGEQIPEFQGHYKDVKESIRKNIAPGTVFKTWFGLADEPVTVPKNKW